jgi:hypothetical protein
MREKGNTADKEPTFLIPYLPLFPFFPFPLFPYYTSAVFRQNLTISVSSVISCSNYQFSPTISCTLPTIFSSIVGA